MRSRLLVAALGGLFVVGFRCPGSEPTLDPATGGVGGLIDPPDPVGAGGMTAGTGGHGVGGGEPPTTACARACEDCDRPKACEILCEEQEDACGETETATCLGLNSCSILGTGLCLVNERSCDVELDFTCRSLCMVMLTQCTASGQEKATQAQCEEACKTGFTEQCGTADERPLLGRARALPIPLDRRRAERVLPHRVPLRGPSVAPSSGGPKSAQGSRAPRPG